MDDDDDDDNLLNDIKNKILLDDLDYIKLTLKNSATNNNIIDVTDISNILDEGDINNLLFYSISMKRLKIFEYFYNEHLYYKDDFYTFNEIYFLLIKENELSLFQYFLNNKIFIENEDQINSLKIFLLKNFVLLIQNFINFSATSSSPLYSQLKCGFYMHHGAKTEPNAIIHAYFLHLYAYTDVKFYPAFNRRKSRFSTTIIGQNLV